MKPVMIACKTIEKEITAAILNQGCEYPVLWLESGLHNWPDKLRDRIQEILDDCSGYDTVLLAMSFCGNSVVGLQTHDFQLVIPRCDDCITLLLGSMARRQAHFATYFLTEGWLAGENNVWLEYQRCVQKYGEKRGKRIFSTMLAHYKYLALVDTGAYDTASIETEVQNIARTLDLEYTCIDGTLGYLEKLLCGEWSEEQFVIIPPHSKVSESDCTLRGMTNGL